MVTLPELLLDHLYDGVYFIDRNNRITYWNKSAERISGYTREEALGKRCSDNLLNHIDRKGVNLCRHGCPLRATMKDHQFREADVFLRHKDGHRVAVSVRAAPVLDENGQCVGAVEIFSDNTQKENLLCRLEEAKQESFTDPLTQVGNRRYAEYFLECRIAEWKISHIDFGVLFIDLDRFKVLNDTWGHGMGDRVLAMTASTIKTSLRSMDAVARYGGEEFLVVAVNINESGLRGLAERIRRFIAESWISAGKELVRVTASIGGALYRKGESAADVIDRADKLLYEAKKAGRNQVRLEPPQAPSLSD